MNDHTSLRDRVHQFVVDHPEMKFSIFGAAPSDYTAVLDSMDDETLWCLLHDMHLCCDVELPDDLERRA